jgi:hypothetical protein
LQILAKSVVDGERDDQRGNASGNSKLSALSFTPSAQAEFRL